MTLPDSSGIYGCFCTVTGKCYVGQAINIKRRTKHHTFLLEKNEHVNPHFQSAWNKYGRDRFVWQVLEECDESILTENEQYWITYFRSYGCDNVYNIANPVQQDVPSERMSQIRNDPVTVARLREKALVREADSERRGRRLSAIHEFWNDEEKRAAASKARAENASKLWESDEHRVAMSVKRAERWRDEKYAKERKTGTAELWQDGAYRNTVTAAITATCNTPEYLAGLKERTRQQWIRFRQRRRERVAALAARLEAARPCTTNSPASS